MGPTNLKFNRPIAIEVPHLASLACDWREVVVLRSENGETWKEHNFAQSPSGVATDAEKAAIRDTMLEVVERVDSDSELRRRNVHRIVTNDFPLYFALVTRVRVQIEQLGSEGGLLNSSVVPAVQSLYPDGALQKRIRIGLQALPITEQLLLRVGKDPRICCSPVVTIEPRRRKFHKPITLAIPIAKTVTQSMLNQSVDTQTLRLLCSITGTFLSLFLAALITPVSSFSSFASSALLSRVNVACMFHHFPNFLGCHLRIALLQLVEPTEPTVSIRHLLAALSDW